MEPAICGAFDYSIPFDRAVPMVRQAGFEIISLGGKPEHSGCGTAEGRALIRRLIAQHGMRIESIHAPFPEGDRLCSLDEGERAESLRQCQGAIDDAGELGVGVVVVHLNTSPDEDVRNRMTAQGFRSLDALSEHALAAGVQLALENSWGEPYGTMLDRVMTQFDAAPVGFCYDSGHENVNGSGFRDLMKYGHRLLVLHLHDNCGQDTHALPYEGTTNWPGFMDGLHTLGYTGSLHLEASPDNSQFKDPAVFLAEAWKRCRRLLENP